MPTNFGGEEGAAGSPMYRKAVEINGMGGDTPIYSTWSIYQKIVVHVPLPDIICVGKEKVSNCIKMLQFYIIKKNKKIDTGPKIDARGDGKLLFFVMGPYNKSQKM